MHYGEVPADIETDWRVVDFLENGGIGWILPSHQEHTALLRAAHLLFQLTMPLPIVQDLRSADAQTGNRLESFQGRAQGVARVGEDLQDGPHARRADFGQKIHGDVGFTAFHAGTISLDCIIGGVLS